MAVAQTALTNRAAAAAAGDRAKGQPGLHASDVFAGQGDKLQAVNESSIAVLGKLIARTSETDPELPDLLFRMAEQHADQARFYSFKARQLDEQIFVAEQGAKRELAARLRAQRGDFEQKQRTWQRSAITHYARVAAGARFASYPKMDLVLFQLAQLLSEDKQDERARPLLRRLIKEYPQSPYLPHAYLAFADHFFESRDLENAVSFYDRVLQYPDSSVYGYALYKKGWVYYNLSDYKSAMATFIDVIGYATRPGRRGQKADAQLVREARKDLVRTYAQVGVPEKAWLFFERYGKDAAPTMLEQLAEVYASQGKHAESTQVYRHLIELSVKKRAFEEQGRLCGWQTEILKNTVAATGARPVPETVKELQRLSAVYEQQRARSDLKPTQLKECKDSTASMLRELAMVWHKEAQSSQSLDGYANAADLYREYIGRFPDEKDSYLAHFYYGELLFQLGTKDTQTPSPHFCAAAPIYTKVVKLDPKGSKLAVAAYAAVMSWKNCLDIADEGQEAASAMAAEIQKKHEKKGEAERLAEKPIPEKQQKLLEAFDTYIRYVPDAPELAAIKYRRAFIYYTYNRFDAAIPLFRELVESSRSGELALYSANLLIECLGAKVTIDKEKGQPESAMAALDAQLGRIEKVPVLMKDALLEKRVRDLRRALIRLEIETVEKSGDARRAGMLYLQFADRYPDDPKLAEVYHNAAVNFEKSNLVGLAIQAREKLVQLRPDDPLAQRSLARIGQSLASIAEYEAAASRFETFAMRYPKASAKPAPGETASPIDAPAALRTAAFYRRGLGDAEGSLADSSRFIRTYGTQKEFAEQAAGLFFDQAQIYEQRRDAPRLKQHLTEYLKKWADKGGIDRHIIAEVKLGELLWSESCPAPGGGVNGACIQITRQRASSASVINASLVRRREASARKQCGPETKSKIVVFDRHPALEKEALGHFDKALALWKDGDVVKSFQSGADADREVRIGQMTYHAAMALMTKGDRIYEALLSMRVPTGLAFDNARPRERLASQRRFVGWMKEKGQRLQTAQGLYRKVISYRSAHWAIAASARIGQLYQDFANGLYTVEIPAIPASPDPRLSRAEWAELFIDAYCGEMANQAIPLDDKAVEGLAMCLNKSTELSWFNEWSQLCEAELNQIKPVQFPLASEIRIQPSLLPGLNFDVAPPVTVAGK